MARRAKGHGVIKQIIDIIDGSCLGPYEIEAALILRGSLLLNGILTNSEVWYGCKLEDFKQLEQIDEILLQKILETPSSTPKCMLYLEIGCKPIRFIFQALYFEGKYRLFSLQNDWALTCKKDLQDLEINLYSDEDMRHVRRTAEFEPRRWDNEDP